MVDDQQHGQPQHAVGRAEGHVVVVDDALARRAPGLLRRLAALAGWPPAAARLILLLCYSDRLLSISFYEK